MTVVPAPVTVVIVHHRQPDKCLATCQAFSEQDLPVRLLVVDNGSSPDDVGRLRERADVEILALGANRGFGPGANAGLRRWLEGGTGEWAVVAPHDARPRPGSLARLVAVAEGRSRAGIACGEYGDDTRAAVDPYFGGLVFPLDVPGPWVSTTHPHGTMLGLRRSCLAEIGLFDERYFAYVEEADLALRAVAAGWEVGMVLGAVVDNPGTSVVRPVVDYLQTRNTLLLLHDHFGRYNAAVRLTLGILGTLHEQLVPSRRAPWFNGRARWLAMADFLRGRFGPPSRYLHAGLDVADRRGSDDVGLVVVPTRPA